MKKYTLTHESPTHFVLHDGKAHFQIAKQGLGADAIKKIQGFAKGGEVQKFDDGGTAQALRESFGKKDVEPTETNEERYARIRQHNTEAFAGTRSSSPDMNLDYNRKTYPENFSDGGTVTPDPDKTKSAEDSMRKAFGFSEGGQATPWANWKENYGNGVQDHKDVEHKMALAKRVERFDDGGEVKSDDQDKDKTPPTYIDPDKAKSVEDSMRKAFNFAEGGKVPKLGTGKRFEKLEHSLSHEEGVRDPAAVAAAIGRKKYGEKKFNALAHHNHLADGGAPAGPNDDLKDGVSPEDFADQSLQNAKEARRKAGLTMQSDDEIRIEAAERQRMHNERRPGYASGGNVDAQTVPTGLSRNMQHASAEVQAAEQKEKDALSVPYEDYGRSDQGGTLPPSPPVTVNYHFYHGGTVPVHHYAEGGETEVGPGVTIPGSAPVPDQTPAAQSDYNAPVPFSPMPLPAQVQAVVPTAENTIAPTPPPSAAVDPSQQVSLAAPSRGPAAAPPAGASPSTLEEFKAGQEQQMKGIQNQADAQATAAQENTEHYKQYLSAEEDRQQAVNDHLKELDDQSQALYDDVLNKKIDPNRLWNNTSTGNKIFATIGLILGGAGAGVTGQPNLAAQFIEKSIAQDIEAQKADQSNKYSLYKAGLERYHNAQSAAQFATIQAHDILSAQLQQTAAKVGTPQAKALADQAIGELRQKDAPLRQGLAVQDYALKMLNQPSDTPTANSGQQLIDNNRWTALKMTGMIKPEDETAATKEAANYIQAEQLRKNLKDSFRKLADKPLAGQLSPGLRDAEMQSLAGVLARVSEGRFNLQESKQQIEAIMPQAKDLFSPSTRQERLKKLDQLIDSTVATPTLDRYNLKRAPKTFTPGAPVIK